jgi:hypothetical protein
MFSCSGAAQTLRLVMETVKQSLSATGVLELRVAPVVHACAITARTRATRAGSRWTLRGFSRFMTSILSL